MRPAAAQMVYFWLFASSVAHATTVIILRTDTEITVGADSRRHDSNGTNIVDTACKISKCGPYFAALTGLDDGRGFNALDLLARACGTDETISNIADEFVRIVKSELPIVVIGGQDDPEMARLTRNGGVILQAAFMGLIQDVPTVIVINIAADSAGRLNIKTTACPPECHVGPGYLREFTMGETAAVENFLKLHPDIVRGERRMVVRQLITEQSQATPNHVGGPIDVLQIRKDGATWLDRKAECEPHQ